MPTDYIIIREYCRCTNMDPEFIVQLEEIGLISISTEGEERCLRAGQLPELEKYARMFYDLSINVEGIDAIHHILNRMEELQKELDDVKSRLRLYE